MLNAKSVKKEQNHSEHKIRLLKNGIIAIKSLILRGRNI